MAARPGPGPSTGNMGPPSSKPPPPNKPPPPARPPPKSNSNSNINSAASPRITSPPSSSSSSSPSASPSSSSNISSTSKPSPPPPPRQQASASASAPSTAIKPKPTVQADAAIRNGSASTPSSPTSPGAPSSISSALSKSNSSSAISSTKPPTPLSTPTSSTATRGLSTSVSTGQLRIIAPSPSPPTSTSTSSSSVSRSSSSSRLPTSSGTSTSTSPSISSTQPLAPQPRRVIGLSSSNSVPQLPLTNVPTSATPSMTARLRNTVSVTNITNTMATGARTTTSNTIAPRSAIMYRVRSFGRLGGGMDDDPDEEYAGTPSPSISPAPPEPQRVPGPTEVAEESTASRMIRTRVDPFPLPFKPEIEEMVKEFEPSDVPLEQPVFDIVIHVDQLFPDLKSCRGPKLQQVITQLEKEVKEVDDVLSKDVLKISLTKDIATRAVATATATIRALQAKIGDIKRKAMISETMTEEICKDVRALDNAKKHLTAVLRAIRNLMMLNDALTKLIQMKEQRLWKEANRTYKFVVEMFKLFDSYQETPHIQTMMIQFSTITKELKIQLFEEFRDNLIMLAKAEKAEEQEFLSHEELDQTREFMFHQCKLMEQIGEHAKMEIIHWFARTRLEQYADEYGVGKPKFNIDTISSRYHVFRNELVEYEKHFTKIFPARWQMQAQMAKEFVDITKRHVAKILAANSQNTTTNKKMAAALMESLKFEKWLTARFVTTLQKATTSVKPPSETNGVINGEILVMEPIVPTFVGMISDCFTPYMVIFEQRERNNLTEKLNEMNKTEEWPEVTHEGTTIIYGTCEALFRYIGESIKAVTTLSTDQTFFNVTKTYYASIDFYMKLLLDRLPENETEAADVDTFVPVALLDRVATTRRDQIDRQALIPTFDQEDVRTCCITMNTCLYAKEMIDMMEKGIKRSIDDRFKDQINFSSLIDGYSQTAVKTIQVLCTDIWYQCRTDLLQMVKFDWGRFEDVGDRSSWLVSVRTTVHRLVREIIDTVDISYHQFLFNQVAQTFIPRYQEEILYQCRKIVPMAAQQLILDTQYIRNEILLELQNITPTPKEIINTGGDEEDEEVIKKRQQQQKEAARKGVKNRVFIRHVQEQMGKCESILKVLSVDDDQLITNFRTFFPSAPIPDLLRIFKLRSLKSEQQKRLIERYNAHVPQEQQIHVESRVWDTLVGRVGDMADLVNPLTMVNRFGQAVRRAGENTDRDRH